jgi:hypothetical protein
VRKNGVNELTAGLQSGARAGQIGQHDLHRGLSVGLQPPDPRELVAVELEDSVIVIVSVRPRKLNNVGDIGILKSQRTGAIPAVVLR